MVLLNALSTDQCAAVKQRFEAGPSLIIISEVCPENPVDDIWFRAGDQRGGLTVSPSVSYGTATDQANPAGIRYEIGKSVTTEINLGRKTIELETLSTMYGAEIVTDAVETTTQYIDVKSAPGSIPTHYQVAILPYTTGGRIRLDFGIVIPYAVPLAEQTQFTFDVNTPIQGSFSFASEPYDIGDLHARIYSSTDGSDVTDLKDVAAEYLVAFPQA